MPVRTRFAPSPTGYLHIGGVRTAIFNWLFAKRHGGQFILRIDDTDQERHRDEALQPILHGFRWLGMQWDEGPEVGGPHAPYFQSQRGSQYRAAANRLVEAGAAYPCFCTTGELDAEREAAKQAKRPYQYSRKCRGLSGADRDRMCAEGRSYVTRFAVPPDRAVTFTDLILGPVAQQTRDINDFVIARGDGSPLYNFASVVDDIEMQITHVIRAQEHLTNSYSQWLIFEALGATMPAFAHVPYVAAPGSKEKISKRKLEPFRALMTPDIAQKLRDLGWTDDNAPNPVMLSYYEGLGYLPDAMLNGLARIGWSLDDKQEKIARADLLAHFSLDRVNSAAASFDPDKLWWLQGEYMKEVPTDHKVDAAIPFLQKANILGSPIGENVRQKLSRIIDAAGDRLKVFSDIIRLAKPIFSEPLEYDPSAVKKNLTGAPSSGLYLQQADSAFEKISTASFTSGVLEQAVRDLATASGVNAGKYIHPLRVAVSGQAVGIGVFDLIELVGPERTHQRIQKTIETFQLNRNPPSAQTEGSAIRDTAKQ